MPKFEVREQQTRFRLTKATGQHFGAIEGRGLQNLGKGVEDLGVYIRKKEDHDELIKAKQAASDAELELIEEIQEMRKNAAIDGKGHSDAARKHIEEKYQKLSEGFGGKAATYIKERGLQSRNSHTAAEIDFQAGLYGKNLAAEEKRIQDKEINAVLADPSLLPGMIGNSLDRQNSYTFNKETGQGISEAAVQAMTKGHRDALSVAAADGTILNASTVEEAEDIASALRTDVWQDRIPSEEYDNLLKRAEAKVARLKREATTNLASTRSRVSSQVADYTSYLLATGNPVDRPDGLSDDSIRALYPDKPDVADAIIGDIRRAETAAPAVSVIKNGSPEEVDAEIARIKGSFGEGPENFRDEQTIMKLLETAAIERDKALVDDPANYALTHSEMLKNKWEDVQNAPTEQRVARTQEFTDLLISEQKRLGVSDYNTRVMTDSQVTYWKEQFNKHRTQEGEDLYTLAQSFKGEMGQHYRKGLNDLYRSKAAPVGFSLLTEVTDPAVGASLAEALKTGEELKKELNLKRDDYDTSGFLEEHFASMPIDTFPGAGRDIAETVAAANSLAIYYKATGRDNPLESAANDVVGNRYDYYDNIRVPKSAEVPRYVVVNALPRVEYGFDERYGDKIDWVKVQSRIDPNASTESIHEDIVASIRAGNMRTLTAPDDSGIMFVSNTGAPLPSLDGGPFVLKWKDLPSPHEPFTPPQPKFTQLGPNRVGK